MFKSTRQASTLKSNSLDRLCVQSNSEPLALVKSIQTSISPPLKPVTNTLHYNNMVEENNASSSSQEPGSAALHKRAMDIQESSATPLIGQQQSQSSCLIADSHEHSSCCHRVRLTASLTSTASMRSCAKEATRYKWRTIGQELRQISEHYERYLMESTQSCSDKNPTNFHHQQQPHSHRRHHHRQNSSHSSELNVDLATRMLTSHCQIGTSSCMSPEWSKLLFLICLTITIRSLREFG